MSLWIDLPIYIVFFFFSSRRRHTRLQGDWSSDVCSSDLLIQFTGVNRVLQALLEGHNNLRLRTKLLLWLVLFTAALTSATLPVVRHSAQEIGRASCRERVEISEVVGGYKVEA